MVNLMNILSGRLKTQKPIVRVMPDYQATYDRFRQLSEDLAAKGMDGVIELLTAFQNDNDIGNITSKTSRKFVARLSRDADKAVNLNIDGDGLYIYSYVPYMGPLADNDPFGNQDYNWEKMIRHYEPVDAVAMLIGNGILDFIRYAPHNNPYGSYLNK